MVIVVSFDNGQFRKPTLAGEQPWPPSRPRGLRLSYARLHSARATIRNYTTRGDTALRDLEARKKELESQLAVEPPERTVSIHPNVGELYRRKVSELQTLLEDEMTRAEAFGTIRSLIDHIEVRPGAKRGQPDVTLVGALASILDFASSKGQASTDGRVLMVAGARNQRCLSLPKCILDPMERPSSFLLK